MNTKTLTLLGKAVILTLLFSMNLLEAYDPVREIAINAGWRRDEITQKIFSKSYNDSPFLSDTLKGRDLDLWQVGVDFNLGIPDCLVDCVWINEFYLRGSAFWGWGNQGNYHDTQKIFTEESSDTSSSEFQSRIHAKTHKARSWDYSLGFGWLYPVDYCFGIGPIIGYSYDKLEFKIKDVKFDEDASFSHSALEDLKIKSAFKGPWIGVDMIYVWCNWSLLAGYEFHFCNRWNGAFTLDGNDVFGGTFSDVRKAHHGYGNVVYANLRWNFCESWETGLGLKFKYFNAKHGTEKPTERSDSEQSSSLIDRLDHAKWMSYQVTLDIAYLF